MEPVVLRYGLLYGPGTWSEGPARKPPLHVDAAAQAALLAVTCRATGIFNIADDDGTVSIGKACKELGFDPAFRLGDLKGLLRKREPFRPYRHGLSTALVRPIRGPVTTSTSPDPRKQFERRRVKRQTVLLHRDSECFADPAGA